MSLHRLPQATSLGALLNATGLEYTLAGDDSLVINGYCAPDEAEPGGLCFVLSPTLDVLANIADKQAAVIVSPDIERGLLSGLALTVVFASNPMRMFIACIEAGLASDVPQTIEVGATIHPGAVLGKNVRVESGAYVDEGVVIGDGCTIHAGVRLYPGVVLGRHVVVQSNTVLGAEGMAFAREASRLIRFPHLGRVLVGDDVMIGPNSTIIRGILKDTVIGEGTKIGSQVNVGHNAVVGDWCFISSGSVFCGSAILEDGCRIAPGVIVLNHVRVGRGASVNAGAIVTRDIPPGCVAAGSPARVIPH